MESGVGDGDRRLGTPEAKAIGHGPGDRRHDQAVYLDDVGRSRVGVVRVHTWGDSSPLVGVDGGHVHEG
jgi:hypothetical protein